MKLKEEWENSNLKLHLGLKNIALGSAKGQFCLEMGHCRKTKKAWISSWPFPALKPIKPIVDIQFMNTAEK